MSGARDEEDGSATVWVLVACGVLALIGAAAVLVATAVVARHRATAAADLAALAGAVLAVEGGDGCGAAARLAAANGAELTGCTASPDGIVDVEVSVPLRLGRLGVHAATARARAGPVAPGAFP